MPRRRRSEDPYWQKVFADYDASRKAITGIKWPSDSEPESEPFRNHDIENPSDEEMLEDSFQELSYEAENAWLETETDTDTESESDHNDPLAAQGMRLRTPSLSLRKKVTLYVPAQIIDELKQIKKQHEFPTLSWLVSELLKDYLKSNHK